jgi:hypothetical protein
MVSSARWCSLVHKDVQTSDLLYGLLNGTFHVVLLSQVRHDGHPMLQLACLFERPFRLSAILVSLNAHEILLNFCFLSHNAN